MDPHGLDPGQRDAVANVRASDGFRPESDTVCVDCDVTGIAYDGAMEAGFAN